MSLQTNMQKNGKGEKEILKEFVQMNSDEQDKIMNQEPWKSALRFYHQYYPLQRKCIFGEISKYLEEKTLYLKTYEACRK